MNHVKNKPYIETKDSDSRPDEEVADECWKNHRARNDSLIVDVCQVRNLLTVIVASYNVYIMCVAIFIIHLLFLVVEFLSPYYMATCKCTKSHLNFLLLLLSNTHAHSH